MEQAPTGRDPLEPEAQKATAWVNQWALMDLPPWVQYGPLSGDAPSASTSASPAVMGSQAETGFHIYSMQRHDPSQD